MASGLIACGVVNLTVIKCIISSYCNIKSYIYALYHVMIGIAYEEDGTKVNKSKLRAMISKLSRF